MGGSTNDVINDATKVATAPITGGWSLIHSKANPLDESFDPLGARAGQRMARTAADQQKDAMVAQQAELVKKKKEAKQNASNLALRNRLVALRGYAASSDRGGTVLTSPTGLPTPIATGGKTLLGT